jgi:hypothetical protein
MCYYYQTFAEIQQKPSEKLSQGTGKIPGVFPRSSCSAQWAYDMRPT